MYKSSEKSVRTASLLCFIDELSDFSFGMVILLITLSLLLPKQLEMFMEIEDSANALSLYSI